MKMFLTPLPVEKIARMAFHVTIGNKIIEIPCSYTQLEYDFESYIIFKRDHNMDNAMRELKAILNKPISE